jgi:hypothetical protein
MWAAWSLPSSNISLGLVFWKVQFSGRYKQQSHYGNAGQWMLLFLSASSNDTGNYHAYNSVGMGVNVLRTKLLLFEIP